MERFVRDLFVFCVTIFGVGFVLLTVHWAPALAVAWFALGVYLIARKRLPRDVQPLHRSRRVGAHFSERV